MEMERDFDVDDTEEEPDAETPVIEAGGTALPEDFTLPEPLTADASFLCGGAGCGKTYLSRQIVSHVPGTILAASTGIAATNLGEGTTINALLKYFDTASLQENYVSGRLGAILGKLYKSGVRRIILDEISMVPAEQLTILSRACEELAGRGYVKDAYQDDEIKATQDEEGTYTEAGERRWPIALQAVGDFLQLPPVKADFAFQSPEWTPHYGPHVHTLTEIRRQSDPAFVEALRAARRGDHRGVCDYFGPRLVQSTEPRFAGTTLFAKNEEVDRYNALRMDDLRTSPQRFHAKRWGTQRGDWKQIPDVLTLKEGALVMILANRREKDYENGRPGRLIYANGDLGTVVALDPTNDRAHVHLKRNGYDVEVITVVRNNEIPLETGRAKALKAEGQEDRIVKDRKMEIVGAVTYLPIRVAYGSTVHKCVALGSRVNVAGRGLLPIEEVRVGMIVLTGDHRQQKVLASAYTGHRELMLVRLQSGILLRLSKDHKLWTASGEFVPPRPGLRVRLNTTRDELAYAVPLPTAVKTPRGKAVTVPTTLSEDLAWLLGALIGDGCYTERTHGMVEFHASAEEVQDDVAEIVRGFGVAVACRKGTKFGAYFTSLSLRRWLAQIGLDYVRAEDKRIPECIFQADVALRAWFLQGLFDTDGSMSLAIGARFVTSSESLARGTQQLLLSVGVYSTLSIRRPGHYRSRGIRVASKRPSYEVRVPVAWCWAFAAFVGFRRKDRAARLASRIARPTKVDAPYKDFGRIDTIVSITSTGLMVPMWDLEVEQDHRFVVDGVLCSNSQGLSLDTVQINLRDGFFKSPAMLYVALSRCRTAEGLRIVGTVEGLRDRCTVDPRVRAWI